MPKQILAILLGAIVVLAIVFAFEQEGPKLLRFLTPKAIEVIRSVWPY